TGWNQLVDSQLSWFSAGPERRRPDQPSSRTGLAVWLSFGRFPVGDWRLPPRGSPAGVQTSDGSEVTARTIILATGVTWRRLGLPTLEALVGAGVFYGAAAAEGGAMGGKT